MQEVQFSVGYEPAFIDVLNDPIIRLLMQYDGLTDEDLTPLRQMVNAPKSDAPSFL
jgi:hypothetical protein